MNGWSSGYRDGHRDGRNAARHRNDELSLLLRGMARRVGEFRALASVFAVSVAAAPETVDPRVTALDVARDVARLWAPYMSTMERPVAVELVAALDRLVAALIADAWDPS